MAKIKSIKTKRYIGKVHDLTVDDLHTYNIKGLSVHNSACGSLLLYCLKVINIDPIEHKLHWWRFLTVDKNNYIDEDCFF